MSLEDCVWQETTTTITTTTTTTYATDDPTTPVSPASLPQPASQQPVSCTSSAVTNVGNNGTSNTVTRLNQQHTNLYQPFPYHPSFYAIHRQQHEAHHLQMHLRELQERLAMLNFEPPLFYLSRSDYDNYNDYALPPPPIAFRFDSPGGGYASSSQKSFSLTDPSYDSMNSSNNENNNNNESGSLISSMFDENDYDDVVEEDSPKKGLLKQMFCLPLHWSNFIWHDLSLRHRVSRDDVFIADDASCTYSTFGAELTCKSNFESLLVIWMLMVCRRENWK